MARGQTKSHWSTKILHVQTVAPQTKFFRKTFNHVREALERVVELRGGGRVAVPVAGIVRRDYAIAIGELRHEVAKHV